MILAGLEGQIKQTKTPKSNSKLEEMYFVFLVSKISTAEEEKQIGDGSKISVLTENLVDKKKCFTTSKDSTTFSVFWDFVEGKFRINYLVEKQGQSIKVLEQYLQAKKPGQEEEQVISVRCSSSSTLLVFCPLVLMPRV